MAVVELVPCQGLATAKPGGAEVAAAVDQPDEDVAFARY
jgi:hypothetical protein